MHAFWAGVKNTPTDWGKHQKSCTVTIYGDWRTARGLGSAQVPFGDGQFAHHGEPASFSFRFFQEDGDWKIDLTSIFPLSNTAFQNMVAESGEQEDAYLLSLLTMLIGQEPGPEVWQPVRP